MRARGRGPRADDARARTRRPGLQLIHSLVMLAMPLGYMLAARWARGSAVLAVLATVIHGGERPGAADVLGCGLIAAAIAVAFVALARQPSAARHSAA